MVHGIQSRAKDDAELKANWTGKFTKNPDRTREEAVSPNENTSQQVSHDPKVWKVYTRWGEREVGKE